MVFSESNACKMKDYMLLYSILFIKNKSAETKEQKKRLLPKKKKNQKQGHLKSFIKRWNKVTTSWEKKTEGF